jgi:hypothetical protein
VSGARQCEAGSPFCLSAQFLFMAEQYARSMQLADNRSALRMFVSSTFAPYDPPSMPALPVRPLTRASPKQGRAGLLHVRHHRLAAVMIRCDFGSGRPPHFRRCPKPATWIADPKPGRGGAVACDDHKAVHEAEYTFRQMPVAESDPRF